MSEHSYVVVYRSKQSEGQVALISGGGSGHEPAHSGEWSSHFPFLFSHSTMQVSWVMECSLVRTLRVILPHTHRVDPAAVCGNIFASPNPGQVQKALELVDNPLGCVTTRQHVYPTN